MRYPKRRNPKAETRNPKEGRNPKAESDSGWEASEISEEAWACANDQESGVLLLKDEAANKRPPQDLEERTAQFGEAIIRFAKKIPQNPVNNRLIDQVVGAGTSVGANYCEADDAVSSKEFKQRIGTCRKESKETKFFLRMIATAEPSLAAEARKLWHEAKELNLIFGAIWRK